MLIGATFTRDLAADGLGGSGRDGAPGGPGGCGAGNGDGSHSTTNGFGGDGGNGGSGGGGGTAQGGAVYLGAASSLVADLTTTGDAATGGAAGAAGAAGVAGGFGQGAPGGTAICFEGSGGGSGTDGAAGARGAAGTGQDRDVFGGARAASRLSVLTRSLPAGTRGRAYSVRLTERGGSGKAAWAAYGLPPGLNVNPGTGVISGKAQLPGTFQVYVTVARGVGWGWAAFPLTIRA